MNFDSSYIFPNLPYNNSEDFEFICVICHCKNDKNSTPCTLPCNDVLCESCLSILKTKDFFECPTCRYISTNEEIAKITPEICNFFGTKMNTLSRKSTKWESPRRICEEHMKPYFDDFYCFFHKKKLCTDCLIEHQYTKCNFKKFTNKDSEELLTMLKTNFIKMNDIGNSFNESLKRLETLTDANLFDDYLTLVKKYNKLLETNSQISKCNLFNNKNYLESSIEMTNFNKICQTLKNKTLISDSNCIRFLTNNFKFPFQIGYLERMVKEFPNVLIYAYNKNFEEIKYFLKFNGDIYSIEKEENKLILLNDEFKFKAYEDESELVVNEVSYKFFDIFIFHDALILLNKESEKNKKMFYFNDKHFVFDFLNIIEVNNNYLKINFRIDMDAETNTVIVKVNKLSFYSDFQIDFVLTDDNKNVYFSRKEQKMRIIQEDNYFKSLIIPGELEVKNGIVKVNTDNGFVHGKVETIEYFRLII